jgi:hypothetical protein
MRHLFLHIGYGKTGTTAIQDFLRRQHGWCQQHGLVSLDGPKLPFGLRFHDLAIAHLTSRQNWDYRLRRPGLALDTNGDMDAIKAEVIAVFDAEFAKVAGQGKSGRFVASSEFLVAMTPAEIAALYDSLFRFFDKITVCVFVQDLFDAVSAHNSWSIINRGGRVHHFLADGTLDFFDYARCIDDWARPLGRFDCKVAVVNFSTIKRARGDSVVAFLKMLSSELSLDLDLAGLPQVKATSNPTPNAHGVEILSAMTHTGVKPEHYTMLRDLLVAHLPTEPKWKLTEADWAPYAAQALTLTQAVNARLPESEWLTLAASPVGLAGT